MTEAALMTAALVAHRFTVVTLPPRTMAHTDRVVAALGLGHRCTVRAVDVAVEELEGGSTHLLDAFVAAARLAVEQDGAEALVLGCAGLADLVEPLRRATGLPVVEGVAAAVGLATSLLQQGLQTSRRSTYAGVPGLPDVAAAWR
jgi:allantoin racemase